MRATAESCGEYLQEIVFIPGGPEAFFTGMLDDVRIYNRALSEAEARYLAGDR